MTRGLIIGCDPGVAGGIVVLSPFGEILEAHSMPTFDVIKPKAKKKVNPDAPPKRVPKTESSVTKRKQIDFKGLFDILEKHFGPSQSPEIYIEEITHLFGLPSSSNFTLGYAAGVLHAAVQTFADEFYLVSPKKWQNGVFDGLDKVMKSNGRVDTKETAKNAFKRIFPDYQGKYNEGIRDAALIAYYGLRGGL